MSWQKQFRNEAASVGGNWNASFACATYATYVTYAWLRGSANAPGTDVFVGLVMSWGMAPRRPGNLRDTAISQLVVNHYQGEGGAAAALASSHGLYPKFIF